MFDAEFAFYGPMGFDIGQLMGNIALGAVAQSLYAKPGSLEAKTRQALAESLVSVIEDLWSTYTQTFQTLFGAEEQAKDLLGTFPGKKDEFLEHFIEGVWRDARGYASLAMIRRIVGVADAPEMRVKDAKARSKTESAALSFAQKQLLLEAADKKGIEDFVKDLRAVVSQSFS
uniref:Uncharacterized protein n=1 Tax=Lotharella oceanica TaxID=641309 RepID=A0A7S2TUL0_9EUKA|mmetsp:Transcript_30363/g.56740  ORF Transcript_30363/g.56740 Transcript_30363/m.56740 type:complete len:173 (+) Transcript_30363:169-687(+)